LRFQCPAPSPFQYAAYFQDTTLESVCEIGIEVPGKHWQNGLPMILIPVKILANAKQRMAAVLDQPSRTELAHAMLHDVLESVGTWVQRPAVSLVTTDPFALDLARKFDFEIIPDANNRSETDAIEMATQVCISRKIDFTLVIPGDIPLLTAPELDNVLHAAPPQGSVLIPAADGRGTNAALRRPPGLFPLRFGNDSFKPHLAAAQATQKPCVVLSLPGIALDVDNPAELHQLAAACGETRSQRLARKWGFGNLPLAANQ
jgi:2-phospho-L-lactate guanylyltransferase